MPSFLGVKILCTSRLKKRVICCNYLSPGKLCIFSTEGSTNICYDFYLSFKFSIQLETLNFCYTTCRMKLQCYYKRSLFKLKHRILAENCEMADSVLLIKSMSQLTPLIKKYMPVCVQY